MNEQDIIRKMFYEVIEVLQSIKNSIDELNIISKENTLRIEDVLSKPQYMK